jgi:hypothetical protein
MSGGLAGLKRAPVYDEVDGGSNGRLLHGVNSHVQTCIAVIKQVYSFLRYSLHCDEKFRNLLLPFAQLGLGLNGIVMVILAEKAGEGRGQSSFSSSV